MIERTDFAKVWTIVGGIMLLAASACSDTPAPVGAGGGGSGGSGGFGDGGSAGTGGSSGAGGSSDAGGSQDAGPGATKAIAGGVGYNCAISSSGVLKCWGDNFVGALGLGDTEKRGDGPGEMGAALPAVALGTGRTAVALSAGDHTCAVLDTGDVKCWGANGMGQLGLGDMRDRGGHAGEMGDDLPAVSLGANRRASAVSVGGSPTAHTCVLLDGGAVKCWGKNASGQLGLGDTNPRGSMPGQMGDALPAVDLGAGRHAVAVSAGQDHTCAVLDNGQLKCWGLNRSGQLGLGDADNRGDAPGELGDALPAVDLGAGRTVLAVASGGAHTCAVLDNGQLKCWGDPSAGQVGLGDNVKRGDGAGEMGDALPPVDLGTGRTALAVAAGPEHTCAVLDNHQVKCWGLNVYGGLGLGDVRARGRDPGEMGDQLPAVDLGRGQNAVAVQAPISTSCALLDDGNVKCWGGNQSGELGIGDKKNRGVAPGELGDALPTINLW
jgi:alpha-tubulin suppressor-like RCC1 family protein